MVSYKGFMLLVVYALLFINYMAVLKPQSLSLQYELQ